MKNEFSYELAKELLEKYLGHIPKRMAHSIASSDYAVQVAEKLIQKGYNVDLGYVDSVGIVHDLGHGIVNIEGGSIEEHALVEMAFFQSLGYTPVGRAMASEFATHEGLNYARNQDGFLDNTFQVNSEFTDDLKELGLPINGENGIRYGDLLSFIKFPDNPKKNIKDNLDEVIRKKLLTPQIVEDQILAYSDLHIQQGEQPYKKSNNMLEVILPNGEEWGVTHGTFQQRIDEINKRFSRSTPNDIKIQECVADSKKRLDGLVAEMNIMMGIPREGYLKPYNHVYQLNK